MNEIIKAMEERRSIRRFKSELPKEEDIAQIVEAGLYAASGRGRQATLTIAVTNKALRDRISEANRKIGPVLRCAGDTYCSCGRELQHVYLRR